MPGGRAAAWECQVCTLHNPANFLVCNACHTVRPEEDVPESPPPPPSDGRPPADDGKKSKQRKKRKHRGPRKPRKRNQGQDVLVLSSDDEGTLKKKAKGPCGKGRGSMKKERSQDAPQEANDPNNPALAVDKSPSSRLLAEYRLQQQAREIEEAEQKVGGGREEEQEAEEEGEAYFGSARVHCVGIRYYQGLVSRGEQVSLEREPTNQYDSNALRVLNLTGLQVGHIKATSACHLSSLLDKRYVERIEGFVPSGTNNQFKIPIQVHLFGKKNHSTAVHKVMRFLEKSSCNSDFSMPSPMQGKKGRGKGMSASDILGGALEKLYQGQAKYEDMAVAQQPAAIRTKLYLHQLKALTWMRQQEKYATVGQAIRGGATGRALFWEKWSGADGRQGYRNSATHSVVFEDPPLARAGIFADDMGLGKTLTTLSLVLSDRPQSPPASSSSSSSSPSLSPTATLVICPLSVMGVWASQIKRHAARDVSVYIYHGPGRSKDAPFLSRHEVVLSTYGTLGAEWAAKKKASPLMKVAWRRVVLDEGHFIKGRTTRFALSAGDLTAERRWVLTGTPIQNKLDELQALLAFLCVAPFSKREWWLSVVIKPIKAASPQGFQRLQAVLRAVCLRRCKHDRVRHQQGGPLVPLLALPSKTCRVVTVDMTRRERGLYDALRKQSQARVAASDGELMRNSAAILTLILRLRQACCHSSLVAEQASGAALTSSSSSSSSAGPLSGPVLDALALLVSSEAEECCICFGILASGREEGSRNEEGGWPAITPCGHTFCRACITRSLAARHTCPLCRGTVTVQSLVIPTVTQLAPPSQGLAGAGGAADAAVEVQGSKIEALLSLLQQTPLGEKVVVFSQFTGLLDICARAIASKGSVGTSVALEGRMSAGQRAKALRSFETESGPRVMLASLRACGVGLTLTSANHIVLMEPFWNPAVEDQAIDRVYRMGQTKPVTVTRFLAKRSVEKQMERLQKNKVAIVSAAFGKKMSNQQLREMRLAELRSLLQAD